MPRSAASTRTDGDALLGIGQVLARLTPEFPDLTPSKLRFLEEQGLITPARAESGYRKFCEDDVARITLILSMQRDHYLPLKVIRTYLDDQDAGRNPQLPVPESLPTILDRSRRLGRDESPRRNTETALRAPDEPSGENRCTARRRRVYCRATSGSGTGHRERAIACSSTTPRSTTDGRVSL